MLKVYKLKTISYKLDYRPCQIEHNAQMIQSKLTPYETNNHWQHTKSIIIGNTLKGNMSIN